MSKPYDIVIIGSGMGGLCSAYILSKEGLNVCVLEKNRQLGGNLQVFSRQKAIFDTGIHYLGGLDEGQNLNQYFKYFGLMDKLKLMRLDEDGYDHITFRGDKNVYKHAQGFDNFVETLAAQFPGERENLQRYVDKIRHICDFFPLYRIRMERKEVSGADFLETDTKAYLETITSNKKLQNVLAGSNALYAGVADKTPLYVHAMVINSYIESSWKCVDGSGQIAKHLSDSIKKMGGTILNYCEAKKFHFSGDSVKEIELTDGRKIEGKHFISNIDISKTLDMVEPGHVRAAYRNRINSLENTKSVFILYVTLKPGSLKYFNYNIYHHHVDDAWDGINYTPENFPKGVAIFSQYSSRHPEHADSLIAMAYMDYSEMEKWKDSVNITPNHVNSRGDDYEAFKQEKSEKIIEALEERIPGIKQNITGYWSSTPLTYRDYIGSRDGNLYGIAKDYRNPLRTFITPKTKIPNLLLTGQNINFHGVLGVTVSSVVTCAELVGHENIVKQIQAAV
ncbi:MAG: phytoene desaturase family protein [Bacteroidia bacterium]